MDISRCSDPASCATQALLTWNRVIQEMGHPAENVRDTSEKRAGYDLSSIREAGEHKVSCTAQGLQRLFEGRGSWAVSTGLIGIRSIAYLIPLRRSMALGLPSPEKGLFSNRFLCRGRAD